MRVSSDAAIGGLTVGLVSACFGLIFALGLGAFRVADVMMIVASLSVMVSGLLVAISVVYSEVRR